MHTSISLPPTIPYRHNLVNTFIPNWAFKAIQAIDTINSNMESNTDKETWMERVKREYLSRGFTQDSFSERLGRSQGWLSKKLGGKRKPTIEEFEEMAKVLTDADEKKPVSPAYLVWGNPSDAYLVAAAANALTRLQKKNESPEDVIDVISIEGQSPGQFTPTAQPSKEDRRKNQRKFKGNERRTHQTPGWKHAGALEVTSNSKTKIDDENKNEDKE